MQWLECACHKPDVCLQNSNFGVAVSLAALIIFVCMLGRACFVFPLIHLHNKWRPENVKIREMVVIWYASHTSSQASLCLPDTLP